jgi:GNAT superfamily N-acetyltransferase
MSAALTPALAAAAIEANIAERCAYLGRWSRVEVHDDPTRLWITSDIQSTLYNQIARARLPHGDDADAAIDEALAPYAAHRHTGFWWTGPADEPSDLGARLEAKGVAAASLPGMAADLTLLGDDQPTPAGLSIQPATDPGTLALWIEAITSAWELTPGFVPIFAEACAAQALGADARWRPYVALLDGTPVGTSSAFYGTDTVGLYYVWTAPHVRRRGIGAALTLSPLRDAHATGSRIATHFSSPAAVGLYRRLGFAEYCRKGQRVFGLPPRPVVHQMQLDLESLGYDVGGADGIYGQKTVRAVMAFQKDHGLEVHPQWGPETRAALDSALLAKQGPTDSVS